MNEFPEFMRRPENKVQISPRAGGMEGYLFEGLDGVQMVCWMCPEGGVSPMHTHDYDEYAIVVEGLFTGTVGGEPVSMGPGDECYIPAGVPHDGSYSTGYRAIDAFGGKRVKREAAK